ncbi:MAG: hypothetical protein HYV95_08405 [Opitutae bacterium]|nr:hypothetical protein [Opitutae bacterium]
MQEPSNREIMQRIVAHLGKDVAIRMVNEAYNAEILANRLGRMEAKPPLSKMTPTSHDLLRLALERVLDVCELAK